MFKNNPCVENFSSWKVWGVLQLKEDFENFVLELFECALKFTG